MLTCNIYGCRDALCMDSTVHYAAGSAYLQALVMAPLLFFFPFYPFLKVLYLSNNEASVYLKASNLTIFAFNTALHGVGVGVSSQNAPYYL